MKIIVRNSDNAVVYAGDNFQLAATGVTGPNFSDPYTTTANATQVTTVVADPVPYIAGCHTYNGAWGILPSKQPQIDAAFAASKTTFIAKVDADVDGIYDAAIGNRGPEYDQASAEANAFKAAGYTGTVPASVSSWATAKGWTTTASADDIIAAATRLTAARDAIRAQRLLRKEQAKAATDATTLAPITAGWSGFVAYIRGQLGV
jgi:hypothetical protein